MTVPVLTKSVLMEKRIKEEGPYATLPAPGNTRTGFWFSGLKEEQEFHDFFLYAVQLISRLMHVTWHKIQNVTGYVQKIMPLNHQCNVPEMREGSLPVWTRIKIVHRMM